jgi:hypothetical protein
MKIFFSVLILIFAWIGLSSLAGPPQLPPDNRIVFLQLEALVAAQIPANTVNGLPSQNVINSVNGAFVRTSNPSIVGSNNNGIVNDPYVGFNWNNFTNFLYFTGGFPSEGASLPFCVDKNNTSNIPTGTTKVISSGATININNSGTVWVQLMSQCNPISNISNAGGRGVWWKKERSLFAGEYATTPNATFSQANRFSLEFMSVTSCSVDFFKKYGCDSGDRK